MISFSIPVKTVSLTNQREHWAVKAERAKTQRSSAARKAKVMCHGKIKPLMTIRLTRIGARILDDDNLRSALKSVRDGIASALRIDDASPLVKWEYWQETGEPRVEVQIT